MANSSDLQSKRIDENQARRLMTCALNLDAARSGHVSLAELRELAIGSGVAAEAFDDAARMRAPWWVRLCLFGVPDRQAAMGFYWLFVGGLCLSPLLTLNPGFRDRWAHPGVRGRGLSYFRELEHLARGAMAG